ncbi:tetratricopeptide repeat protein [Lignipirellula cremea]|uniref:Tol-pal system protein YbgF n=1 Tax=Lignipirellula cremea TaxID=2528010 RepID=A0A518E4S4_9BACT|nr:tetratricopeptide repeat protein [Lignipirellula cremea]QDU99087.1 tol-pal system protein YbgF [Lignipirellula cremea]
MRRNSQPWPVRVWLAVCLAGGLALSAAEAQEPGAKIELDKESSPAAAAVYTDAANFQNNGVFDLAIVDWEKFLTRYPKDPLRPKAEYYLGVCAMQLKKYDRAEKAFASVVKNFPQFDNREDAWLNLGWCQYQLAQTATEEQEKAYEKPAATFAAMLQEFPSDKGKRADQALFFQGEALYHQGDREGSLAPYAALVEEHPDSPLRADGLYALGVTREELQKFAEAAPVYDLFLQEFPDHSLATEIAMRKAETILQKGLSLEADDKTEEAKTAFKEASQAFAGAAAAENFVSADHALYRQALSESKAGDYGASGDLYAAIPKKFPQSRYVDEATLAAARTYYRAEKFPEAKLWFQKILDAGGPDAPEAAHWICRILLRDGDPAAAAALAAKTASTAGDSKYLVSLQIDEADALDRIPESREEAIAKYLAVAQAHPDDEQSAKALYNAAFTALELRSFEPAQQHVDTFLKGYPDNFYEADVKHISAEAQLALGNYGESEKVYRELIGKFAARPEIEQWRVRLAYSLYLQKKYDEAIEMLQPILGELKKPGSQADAQFLLGASQFYKGEAAAAEASLSASYATAQKALAQGDDKPRQPTDETLLLLARAQHQQKKYDEAIATAKKLLEEFPQSQLVAQTLFRYGQFCYDKADYPTAIVQYQASATADPESEFAPYAWYGKGWAEINAKEFAAGQESFTKVITDWPDHALQPQSLSARGMCYRQTGKYEEAVADFDNFLKTDAKPRDKADALYEKGLALVELKKYEEAVKALNEVLTVDPEYPATDQVLYELAWAYKSQDDDEAKAQALKTFASLAEKFPKSSRAAEAFVHVGENLYAEKKYTEAAAAYTKAKALSTQDELSEKILYMLGFANYLSEDYEQSLAQFSEQTTRFPKGPQYRQGLYMVAESLFKLKNYKDALPAYKAARTAAEGAEGVDELAQVLILLHGGQSAGQIEDWKTSLEYLTPIPTDFPKTPYLAEANFAIGEAHLKLKDHEKAIPFFTLAAEGSREEVGARARFMLGEVHFLDKRYDDAEKELLRCLFGYGGDAAGEKVKNWQAKSAYELGRVNEVQINTAQGAEKSEAIQDALKYYQILVDKYPTDSLVKTAAGRIAELKKAKR